MHRLYPRRGQASFWALLALPVLLGTLLLVVWLFRTRDSAIELRNAGVACALAAVEGLAGDACLTGDPECVRPVLDRARLTAQTVAGQNLVEGRRVRLGGDDQKDHDKDDVVFGHLDRAVGDKFEPFDLKRARTLDWGRINAVEVTVRHPGKGKEMQFTRVTAVLDSAVIGFRPWDGKPAPLVPVALFDADDEDEHPTWSGRRKHGKDERRFDPAEGRFAAGGDGLPEVRVRVGRQRTSAHDEVAGFPVLFGEGDERNAAEQVRGGVTAGDLRGREFGGEIKLRDDNTLPVEGDPDLFRHDAGEQAFRGLAASGEPRVWPVFGGFDDDGRAVLTGFTAARVVAVERDGKPGSLVLILQPTMAVSPTAISDPSRTDSKGRPFGTRLVAKVRLAG